MSGGRTGFPETQPEKPAREAPSLGAYWRTGFVDNPQSAIPIFAAARFPYPDAPDREKRYGVVGREIVYMDPSDNHVYREPPETITELCAKLRPGMYSARKAWARPRVRRAGTGQRKSGSETRPRAGQCSSRPNLCQYDSGASISSTGRAMRKQRIQSQGVHLLSGRRLGIGRPNAVHNSSTAKIAAVNPAPGGPDKHDQGNTQDYVAGKI